MINWATFISQCFNGLVLGALLALIASGLTIIYGTLGVLNLAHGAMFMLGGYAGWLTYSYTDSFIVAVAGGAIVRHDGWRVDGVARHPLFLQSPARGPAAGHFRPRHRFRRGGAVLFRQPLENRAAAGDAAGHHAARFHVLPDLPPRAAWHRRRRATGTLSRTLSHAHRHDRTRRH